MSAVRRRTVLVAACSALLLTACGQKGPLTLPDKNATVVRTPPAASTPATPAAAPPDKSKAKSANSQPPQ
jgi:predicted small lipoprotein YifL